QPNVPIERLELQPGGPRGDREAETVLGLAGELHRETGAEVAVERRHRDGDVGFLGDRYAQVAVVGREAVAAAILDGPVVRHVAVPWTVSAVISPWLPSTEMSV